MPVDRKQISFQDHNRTREEQMRAMVKEVQTSAIATGV